jgi:NADH-quinone oxidoreductase subunit L
VVDATVDFIATTIYKTGEGTHTMQNGNLSSMLRWMVIGVVVLLIAAVAFAFGLQVAG